MRFESEIGHGGDWLPSNQVCRVDGVAGAGAVVVRPVGVTPLYLVVKCRVLAA